MKKVRESNFELLRCIFMFMVVLVHYNNTSMGKAFLYVEPNSINQYFTYFMESLAIIGTNGFVLLTGYFSWKKEETSLRKPIGLLIYVAAYKVAFFFFNMILLKEPFSIKTFAFSFVPSNWYITLYVVLVLLSPYINILLKQLTKKSQLTLIVIMMLVFSVWPTVLDVAGGVIGMDTMGMNTVALNGADGGYTIVNFVMLYIIGATISQHDLLKHSLKWDLIGYILCSIILTVQELMLCAGWSYANPIVILSTVCFFNIFRKIHVSSNVINVISKASLGVFLIHTQPLICGYVWSKCGIETACQGSLLGLAVNMLICCIGTYVVCTLLDTFCRWLTTPVSKMLDKISFLNRNIVTNCKTSI